MFLLQNRITLYVIDTICHVYGIGLINLELCLSCASMVTPD